MSLNNDETRCEAKIKKPKIKNIHQSFSKEIIKILEKIYIKNLFKY